MKQPKNHDAPKAVWLDPSWLSWEPVGFSHQPLARKALLRAYEIHQHATAKLNQDATDLDRVDAITTLKRAVSQRVRVLKNAYDLERLPLKNKPRRDFELLAFLGIVRPLMLRRLVEIRNLIEHEDARPPSVDECLVFADFVWYFLRSTDSLANARATGIEFQSPEAGTNGNPSIEVDYDNNRSVKVRGFLESSGFSNERREDWIEVQRSVFDDSLGDGITLINGEIRGPDEQIKLMWLSYFAQPF